MAEPQYYPDFSPRREREDELMARLIEGEQTRVRGNLPWESTTWGNVRAAVPQFVEDAYNATGRFLTGQHAGPVPSPNDPVIDALAASTAVGGPSSLRAAIAGVPNLGQAGIFGGVGAKTADKVALQRAQQMTGEGVPREQIWQQTGWFQGPEGQWRFEIDDSLAQQRFEQMPRQDYAGTEYMKGDVAQALYHPELGAAYPDMQDIQMAYYPKGGGGRKGAYYPAVGPNPLPEQISVWNPDYQAGKSTLLHELQHAIQERENFARGGNPSDPAIGQLFPNPKYAQYQARKAEVDRANELIESPEYKIEREAAEDLWNEEFAPRLTKLELAEDTTGSMDAMKAVDDLFAEYKAEKAKRFPLGAFVDDIVQNVGLKEPSEFIPSHEVYRRATGEAEARLVQARRDLTPEQRRMRAPWLDYDVPEDQLLSILVDPDRANR